MLEQRSDSLQVNTAQSQARVLSLEQEKVLYTIRFLFDLSLNEHFIPSSTCLGYCVLC